jgi:putative ABC transport system ATP-binding protein
VPRVLAEGLEITYGTGASRTHALRGVTIELEPQTFTLVMGPSGSGKTSLLTILGALARPDAGRVLVDGVDLTSLPERALAEFRRVHVGFIFQSFRLMTGLSAEENIRMSLAMRGMRNTKKLARRALDAVGLADKRRLKSDELSGGEKQRVAIARALAHQPSIIFADEPTASLDSVNGARVSELLAETLTQRGRVLLVVTHDDRLLTRAHRVIRIEDGRIIQDQRQCA